jgi:cytoskeletal protein CcmA (bactofilin family)
MANVQERPTGRNEAAIDTVLAEDIDFTGKLVFEKSLRIEGRFSGEIEAKGTLVVGERAEVKASITAVEVRNLGTIIGNVSAGRRVEICGKAVLRGDIRTPELVIQPGGLFNGRCEMPEGGAGV